MKYIYRIGKKHRKRCYFGGKAITKHEIDRHAKNCSKTKTKALKKTNFRVSLFQRERYLRSDTLYTTIKDHFFLAKCSCRGSMKKVKQNVLVHISRRTTISYIIFWDFLMFYQIFLSPKVKRWLIITYKHGINKLPQELVNDLRPRILGN